MKNFYSTDRYLEKREKTLKVEHENDIAIRWKKQMRARG